MFAGDEHLERFINSLLRKVAERRRGGRSGAGSHQELEAVPMGRAARLLHARDGPRHEKADLQWAPTDESAF